MPDADATRRLRRRAGRAGVRRRAPRPPPLDRARAGTGRLPAVPGSEVRDRPADPGRLLLRLRPSLADQGGRPALRSRTRCGRSSRPTSRSSGKRSPGRTPSRASRTSRSSGRSSRRSGRPRARSPSGEIVSLYRNDGWVGSVRGAARPVDRPARRVQADLDRGRVLARRRDEPDAHPDLRDRVGDPGGPRGAPACGWRRRRSATTAGWAVSSTCSRARTSSGRGCGSGIRAAGSSARSSRIGSATSTSTRGYDLVVTPHIARSVLWETSGHLEKYRENMYPPMEADTGDYYVKPMNCPFHVLVYKSQVRSYRDLPMRLSELGTIYRHEKAGTLHGLLRIRGGTQDDSHIICTPGPADRRDPRGVRPHARDPSDVRLHRPRGGALDAARRPVDRRRGDGGARHRGADPRAREERARLSRSPRARAPSTGPRSTSTSATRSAASGS